MHLVSDSVFRDFHIPDELRSATAARPSGCTEFAHWSSVLEPTGRNYK